MGSYEGLTWYARPASGSLITKEGRKMEKTKNEEMREFWETITSAMENDPSIIVLDLNNQIEYCSCNN